MSARTVERIVETHTRRDGLTSEQADAVRILATSERGLGLLGGAARSGKTSSLAAFAEALDYGGYTLIGAARASVAAMSPRIGSPWPGQATERSSSARRRSESADCSTSQLHAAPGR